MAPTNSRLTNTCAPGTSLVIRSTAVVGGAVDRVTVGRPLRVLRPAVEPLEQVVALTSENYARIAGLAGKASLDVGADADLVVIDLDRNGRWDGQDLIDGFDDEAGFYAVHDVTQPGPLAVTEVIYTGGTFLGQDLYYPTDIANLPGLRPLVTVSHGNGHNYQWYDHIGEHLASYGFVVMSHENNTMPGSHTAATTTLTNTQYILANLATIAGGALNNHVDTHNIVWIGHSRGGGDATVVVWLPV